MNYCNNQLKMRAIIMDHFETPSNKGIENISDINSYLSVNNRSESCIDNITVYLKLDQNKKIVDARFTGVACAISSASTDIFCSLIKNKNVKEIKKILLEYFKMVSGKSYKDDLLYELNVFVNISKQPNRLRCALLIHGSILKILEGVN